MINLQNPNIPAPTKAVEIDRAIYKLQLHLNSKLDWLTHNYGRAYRHLEKNNKRLYFPEVYIGGKKNDYYRVTPDNDKKGTCFFVVGKENTQDYKRNNYAYMNWDVGIVFWANLKKINETLLENEYFMQNLIKDVRNALTHNMRGINFQFKIKSVETDFKQVYKEFRLEEENEYHRAPYTGFRFNLEVVLNEECENFMFDREKALIDNFSHEEKTIILNSLDFSEDSIFDSLTQQQKNDLQIKLTP